MAEEPEKIELGAEQKTKLLKFGLEAAAEDQEDEEDLSLPSNGSSSELSPQSIATGPSSFKTPSMSVSKIPSEDG